MLTKTFNFNNISDYKNQSEEGTVEGYGSVFGVIDSDGETIARGAFSDSIKQSETFPLLWQHDINKPIGIIDRAEENTEGLLISARLALDPGGTQQATEAYNLLKRGIIRSFSIGFIPQESDVDGNGIRTFKKVDLKEVSLVTLPANKLAAITEVKSFKVETEGLRKSIRELTLLNLSLELNNLEYALS